MEKDECFCITQPLGNETPDRRTTEWCSWCETCGHIYNRDKAMRNEQKKEMSKIFEPLYGRKSNGV